MSGPRNLSQNTMGASHESRNPCHFHARGNCKFGSKCKFSHDVAAPKDALPKGSGHSQARDRSKNPQPRNGDLQEWKRFLHRNERLPSPAATGRFFQLGLDLMDGDVGAAQDAIKDLASEHGLRLINDVTDRHLQQAQTDNTRLTCWTVELKPLFQLLTHPQVINSFSLEQQVATLFNFLYGTGGRRTARLFGSIRQLVQSWPPSATQTSRIQVIELSLAVLSKIIDCNTTTVIDATFSELVTCFTKCLDHAEITHPGDELSVLQAAKYVTFMRRKLEVGEAIDVWDDPVQKTAAHEQFVLKKDLPGQLSAQGPRHDNDHADISKIQILPTRDEIKSPRGEYLPGVDSSQWHLTGIQGRLDREFRLLREDTVGQLRDTIRETLDLIRKPKKKMAHRSNRGLRTFMYEAPVPVTVEIDRRGGLELVVRCNQPQAVNELGAQERRHWWTCSKFLQAGALVCVINATGSITFFTVSESTIRTKDDERVRRDRATLDDPNANKNHTVHTLAEDKDFLYVRLQLVEPNARDVTQALRWYKSIGPPRDQYLVEFPGLLLASFLHTLQSLQKMQDRGDVPFGELLAPSSDVSGTMVMKPAQYARRPGFAFDLQCLVTDDEELVVSPTAHPDVDEVSSRTALDPTQSAALLSTLAREFSLIQGPPGTGKSYTGEKVIKVLLANKEKSRLGPIICVCYTNHALDQSLEHLLDDGMKNIIRMGSRSKSERLQNLNLRAIAQKSERTKFEGRELYSVTAAINETTRELNESLDELARSASLPSLKQFLRDNFPTHAHVLFGSGDDEWTTVQSKPQKALNKWLRGGSCEAVQVREPEALEQLRLSTLSHDERTALHQHWLKSIRDPIISRIARQHKEYVRMRDTRDRIHRECDLRCLQQADIIGVTTSGLARNSDLLRKVQSKILLCEEAGEVLEAHILTALLPSLEHAILIGDHLQLRPQIQNYELQSTNPRGEQYSLDTSLFERLIQPANGARSFPFNILETQRRMHPSIAELVRSTLYPSLKDSDSVRDYPKVAGMKDRLFWLHHEYPEAAAQSHDPVNTSHSNDYEINMTAALVSHLVRQGEYSQGDIAVLTPYLGQLHKLRRRMESMFEVCVSDRDLEDLAALDADNAEEIRAPKPPIRKSTLLKSVRVATVDNFQGEEAKVIVISLVRSNPQNKCGFLSTSNRINVLLSRAKHGMYIIGNSNSCMRVPMWADVINLLKKTDAFGPSLALQCPRHPQTPILVSNEDDFARFSPESGCNLRCEKRHACGHSCSGRCHSDVLHNAVKCLKDCPRPMKGCDHPCPYRCGDVCRERCEVVLKDITLKLQCGHTVSAPKCWQAQNPETIRCSTRAKRTVPGCNHEVEVKCYQDVTTDSYRCEAVCSHLSSCGHSCKSRCFECNTREDGQVMKENHGVCKQVCGRNHTTCRHSCLQACHGEKKCPPCAQPCEVRCSHSRCAKPCHEPCAPCAAKECLSKCQHTQCTMPCAAPCNWVPCSKRCETLLDCGHQCPSLCGETCPDAMYCQQCGTDAIKSTCVDFLEMKEYREIDLNEEPCIFPDCGHFLTVSSMDGQMDMNAHYDIDKDGFPSAVLGASEAFAMNETEAKVCPSCRGSLRNLARYGRIVRRVMLDEATKKFIAWSNSKYIKLSEQLLAELEILETNPPTISATTTVPIQTLDLSGSRLEQLRGVQAAIGNGRYDGILTLWIKVNKFGRQVKAEEQPFQRVADLVRFANHQNRTDHAFRFDESVVQVKGHLLATAVLLKCDIAILTDFINICKNNALRFSKVKLDVNVHIRDCAAMTQLAHDTKHPREEVQGHIFSAQLYVMVEYFDNGKQSGGPETAASIMNENGDRSQHQNGPLKLAQHHIDEARTLMEMFPSTRPFQGELDAIQAALKNGTYQKVTVEEMRAVYEAMAREFRGTGHWYTCQNGHPFTIGECGMPMELARCPECNAAIGGQRHTAVDGVQRGDEIEQLGRDFAEMRS